MPLLKSSILLLLMSLVTSASAALTGQWSFDTLNDSVTSIAGAVSGGASIGGGQLNLTGTGGFSANSTGGLGGNGSFTVVMDISTTATSDQTIFSYSPSGGSTAGGDLRFFTLGNGNVRIEMSNGAGHNISLAVPNINDGNTHRVATVFDSSVGDSFYDVDVYVDGTFYDVTSGVDATVNLGGSGNPNEVSFGYQVHFDSNRPFTGSMDFVQIYDSALSGSTIDAIPEPSMLVLLSGGLALIGMVKLRSR